MPDLDVQGMRLHYETRGQGDPLLCLPGALGTGASDFAPQLAGLSASCRVIAPDPRGYGQSRPPPRDFPPDFLQRDADDMAALMTALGYAAFDVAGWSDGANSALLMALAYPQRVRKLIVWGGNTHVTADDLALYEAVRDLASWSPRMRAHLEAIYGDDLQRLWSAWCDGQQAIYRAGGEICRRRVHFVRCPTLILHGERDPLVPAAHPHFLHQSIPNARLHLFPDGRHNIHQAYASQFNQLVRAFLQGEKGV